MCATPMPGSRKWGDSIVADEGKYRSGEAIGGATLPVRVFPSCETPAEVILLTDEEEITENIRSMHRMFRWSMGAECLERTRP